MTMTKALNSFKVDSVEITFSTWIQFFNHLDKNTNLHKYIEGCMHKSDLTDSQIVVTHNCRRDDQ